MSKQELIAHSKPKSQRKITYFCRLCRNYHITSRKAHLKNYHKADPDTISKRATNDIIDVTFRELLNEN